MIELNEKGLVIDVFPEARKSCDKFATIKSNNCLPYIMAAIYGKQHRLNETIILNAKDRVADTTIANLFIVDDKKLITPPLSEGCVCGVMRKHIIDMDLPFKVIERPLTIADLENADEIFLTNAITGVRWVGQFRENNYGNAAAVILAHNHPSGDIAPSQADKAITQRLVQALQLVDIRVPDHLIVGGTQTLSFAEHGLL